MALTVPCSQELHGRGINVRHLGMHAMIRFSMDCTSFVVASSPGLLRSLVKSRVDVRDALLVEIVGRTLKAMLR